MPNASKPIVWMDLSRRITLMHYSAHYEAVTYSWRNYTCTFTRVSGALSLCQVYYTRGGYLSESPGMILF